MVVLALLHHAGGSGAVFKPLVKALPDAVAPLVLELPGRGLRWREPPAESARQAVQDLTDHLRARVDDTSRIAILGHSLGAYLGLAVAAELEKRQGPRCDVLFASANSAPWSASRLFPQPLEQVSDEEIARTAGHFSPPDEALWSDPELSARAAAILRSDFRVADSFVQTMRFTVTESRIVVCRGKDDIFNDQHTDAWRLSSVQEVETIDFPGGHFYLMSEAKALAGVIADQLAVAGP